MRTTFFSLVDAGVMVMTLPDLETFHLKRSVHPVHYVYVFHSMVSTHLIYRKGAFDAYDTILCVGPHHVAEIRRTEEVYGLAPKELVEHGYGRLDTILRTAAKRPDRHRAPRAQAGGSAGALVGRVLVHRSAGRRRADRPAARGGPSVVLRLHPMTVRRFPKLGGGWTGDSATRGLRIETDMREQASLQESDLMIGDWSGAALEYAFGLERPVLFIDDAQKVNNPEYERIGLSHLEESIRAEIGAIVDPQDIGRVPLVDALPPIPKLPGAAARGAGARCLQYRPQRERRRGHDGAPRRRRPSDDESRTGR